MSANADIATLFDRMAKMLEVTGANRFRVNAHSKAARVIRDHPTDVTTMSKSELTALDGIGDGTAKKILEYAETGDIDEFDEMASKVPEGVLEIMELPGVGPKTAKLLWDERGITDVAGLKRAIADGNLEGLKGLGKKSIEKMEKAIEFAAKGQGRTPIGVVLPLAERLVETMQGVKGVQRVAYAGSLRRGEETIGDIDILCVATDRDRAREAFTSIKGVVDVLASGDKKSSVRIEHRSRTIQADLRLVEKDQWGAALMYFTGSKDHNVRLREVAIKQGLTLNEYGLFPDDGSDETPPQERGVTPVAAATEEDVYEALGRVYVVPELRQDRGETAEDWAAPDLIELDDIKAELHAHTTASDGTMTIEELAKHAKSRGFHTICVTDHSKSSVIAHGLDEDRLRAHIDAVREVNETIKGITVLAGSEVDILADGSLDYDDDLLAQLDIVVASPHHALEQDPKTANARLIRAIEHPLVHIIGHPSGRLILSRKGFELDIDTLAGAAREHHVALEVNANPKRLDLRDTHVRAALAQDATIAIDCDVHRPDHYDFLRYGVLTARRGGLTKERCVNAWTKAKLHKWLKSKR
ncbi:MAG: DNA polymerase/3'-5' exonuclease PolX [Phycisphaerales bacterium]